MRSVLQRTRSSCSPGSRNKKSFFSKNLVQAKLNINQPDDSYEQEADSIANKVMKEPAAETNSLFFQPVSIQAIPLQRKESSAVNTPPVTPSVQQALNATGQPMDKNTRSFMEQRFGYDFSQVQIHNDSIAHQSAADINARAYTHGNHLVFAAGQYQLDKHTGKHLLAHELVHVMQQAQTTMIQRAPLDAEKIFATELAYLKSLRDTQKIAGGKSSRLTAVKIVNDLWFTGHPLFMLTPALKLLLMEEIMAAKGTLPADYQLALIRLVESMGADEFALIFSKITKASLKKLLDKTNTGKFNTHEILVGKMATASNEVFDPEKIIMLRDIFLSNAELKKGAKEVCIVILENQLARAYKGDKKESAVAKAMKDSGTATTVGGVPLGADSVDNLIYQLGKAAVISDTFVTDYGRVTDPSGKRVKIPAAKMNNSAWDWIKTTVGDEVGWHIFIMSLKHGHHSITLFVEKRASQEMILYWADQNWTSHEGYLSKANSLAGFKNYTSSTFDDYVDLATGIFWEEAFKKGEADALAEAKKKKITLSKNDIYRKADTKTKLTIVKLKRESKTSAFHL